MKNLILVGVGVCAVIFSCKKNETPQFEEPPKVELLPAIVDECYFYSNGKDTIAASLTIEAEKVTGKLDYKFFEKDKNSGSFSGMMKGDTLIGDYTFQSEGTTSVRQVAFIRKNKSLVEGYGESEEKEGKMVFKNLKKLNFSDNMVLNVIPCE